MLLNVIFAFPLHTETFSYPVALNLNQTANVKGIFEIKYQSSNNIQIIYDVLKRSDILQKLFSVLPRSYWLILYDCKLLLCLWYLSSALIAF